MGLFADLATAEAITPDTASDSLSRYSLLSVNGVNTTIGNNDSNGNG